MFDNGSAHNLKRNRLLSALPRGELAYFSQFFETVELSRGLSIGSPGKTDEFAYFPIDSIISLVSSMEDENLELAMVGPDGATGVYNALGFNSLQYKCVVRVPGRALRVKSDVLRGQFTRHTDFSVLLLQYLHALYAQIAQVAVCYRRHRASERLRTWMMMMFNRLDADNLDLKQEEIAETLGYRRQTISAATAALQESGIISYGRGRIFLLDPDRLRRSTCECYDIMESQYARVELPSPASAPEKAIIPESMSLADAANHYIEQLGTAINSVRAICAKNQAVFERQEQILNNRIDFHQD